MRRFEATFNRDPDELIEGAPIHPLSHWCLFLSEAKQSQLGEDGHPARGHFLPPVHHLPRRMWAGSRLEFFKPIEIGMELARVSTIKAVKEKQGASGPLIFVTVNHDICEVKGQSLLSEEHDIVYRPLDGPAVKHAPEAPEPAIWRRSYRPDAVLLFRYSALTFNSHRIHYDRKYVQDIEGYPGLIVHGPLIATLLLDGLLAQVRDGRLARFSFRALSPLFDGETMTVNATKPDSTGLTKLWAENSQRRLAMQAEACIL